MRYSQTARVASSSFLLSERNSDLDGVQVGMIPSAKFESMLRRIWSNPVFGDSFPPDLLLATALHQMEVIYPPFASTLGLVLTQGLPLLSGVEVNKLVERIAAISVLSCVAVAAGEIADS